MADILKKLAAVVFLTMLIWAWAYLALEETMDPLPTGTLDISPAIRQDLLVSFENQSGPVSLNKLEIKGPPSQIAELKKRLGASDDNPDKVRLEFLYNPESRGHLATESHELNIVAFLNKSDILKKAVTVVSCEPSKIKVKVEKLTKKRLAIQCLDVDNARLDDATIDPAIIQMFDPANWTGTATVILTDREIANARQGPVERKPFIELIKDKPVFSNDTVSITLPLTENPLEPRTEQPTIGYICSKNFWDKYTVELINKSDLRTIHFKASERAFIAYEKTAYQILIEVLPGDETAEDAIHRPVIYNFPEEFVQKGEIKLVEPEPPRVAIFKLVPISESPN